MSASTSRSVPIAAPGILTGVILSLSRALGETAPLITLGALQIGLLDPICLMYRSVATVFAPMFDMTIEQGMKMVISGGIVTPSLTGGRRIEPPARRARSRSSRKWYRLTLMRSGLPTGVISTRSCTSSATPFAAGGAARMLLEARRILGDTGTGVTKGVVASGPKGRVKDGPLADGEFTLEEWKKRPWLDRVKETGAAAIKYWL